MEESRTEEIREEDTKSCATNCPFGRMTEEWRSLFGSGSEFRRHMTQSRLEFLRGVRSLIDAKITRLEKDAARPRKKAERIVVDEV